eukprot:s2242_g2.t1
MDTLVWPPLVEPLLQDRVPEQNMWEMIGLESEDCPGLQLKVKDVMDVSTTADADSKDDFDSSLGLGTSEVHDPVPVANAPSPASFEQELAPTPCEEAAQEPPAGLDIPAEESEDGQDLTNTEEEASIEQEEVGEVPEETDRGMDPPEQAERPGVLKRLPPISPAEQVKLSKPDKDPKKAGRGGRGRGGRGRGGRGRGVEKACAASRGRKRERSGESEPSESEPAAKGPKTRRAKAKAKATVSKAPPTDEATVHYSEEDESAEESQENGRTMKTARHREPEVCYTRGFCESLLTCYEGRGLPPADLRHKHPIDFTKTDRKLWLSGTLTQSFLNVLPDRDWYRAVGLQGHAEALGHLGRQQLVINPSHDATVFDEGVYALHTYVPSVNLGEKLKQLLIKHGSFKEVEHKISKYNLNKHKDARVGKWVTKAYLIDKQMADNSFLWAAARKLTRTNEVHKCEEAKLVLEETFTTENEKGEHRELTGEATIEASSMLHIGLSNHDEDGALMDDWEMGGDATVHGATTGAEQAKLAEANAAHGAGAKYVFPTLQKNESPCAILPTFLQVLGRKIETATTAQDTCTATESTSYFCMHSDEASSSGSDVVEALMGDLEKGATELRVTNVAPFGAFVDVGAARNAKILIEPRLWKQFHVGDRIDECVVKEVELDKRRFCVTLQNAEAAIAENRVPLEELYCL